MMILYPIHTAKGHNWRWWQFYMGQSKIAKSLAKILVVDYDRPDLGQSWQLSVRIIYEQFAGSVATVQDLKEFNRLSHNLHDIFEEIFK